MGMQDATVLVQCDFEVFGHVQGVYQNIFWSVIVISAGKENPLKFQWTFSESAQELVI
jgi:hypothetical protein